MAENLSGVPPTVTLSGLDAGAGGGGFSGASQQSLGGTGGYGTNPFGMEGGLDLNQLMALLAGGDQTAGVGTGSSILQSLSQGSLGQQAGGLSAGSFGQSQPGYVAGQSAGSGAAQAASDAAGSSDPLAMIQKILGLATKGAGLLGGGGGTGASTASPTADAGTSGTSPFGTPTGGEQAAFQTGVASPVNPGEDLYQSGMFQGGLSGGGNLLSDPTLGSLFATGKLNGWDGSMESLNNLMASDPSIRNALFSGQVGGSLGENLAGGDTSGFTLGTGSGGFDTSGGGNAGGGLLGSATAGLGGAQSLLGIVQAAQQGNIGGALQSTLSLYQSLASLSQGPLGNALGVSLPSITQGIGSLIASYAPEVAQALVTALGTGGAAAGASGAALTGPALASATSAALGATLGAAAPFIAAATSYVGNQEELNARNSGWWNNPIRGALYSGATSGVQNANDIFNTLGSDLSGASTEDLARAVTSGANSLLPYYGTAQGGRGAIRASDTVTGKAAGSGGTGTPYTEGGASPEQYTQNFTQAQTGLVNAVQELLKRGVTYEQLGQLPVSGNWALQTLDASDPLQALYAGNAAKYDTAAQPYLASANASGRTILGSQEADQMAAQGLNPATFGYSQDAQGNWSKAAGGVNATPEMLLKAALGASQAGPDAITKASGLYTSMFGGPLWASLARMGAGGPEIQSMIQQNFNPWAMVGQMTPEQINTSLMPILQQYQREQALRQQEFTTGAASGGGVSGGGVGSGSGGGDAGGF